MSGIGAIALGVAVLLAGNLPWAALLAPLNLRVGPSVPWSVAPMAAYLWLYWKFVTADDGSRPDGAWRRDYARANRISSATWQVALLTGVAGFAALIAFVRVMARLVILPASTPIIMPAGMSPVSMFTLLIMGSVVAGVTEEVAFRGYMQTPLERRYGLPAAILICGIAFGLLHFPNHPRHVMVMLPYYIAVTAVYAGITSAANSIRPAVVLHVLGDVWSLTRLWVTGAPEWQAATPSEQIWQTGADRDFVVALVALVALSALTAWLAMQTRTRARRHATQAD